MGLFDKLRSGRKRDGSGDAYAPSGRTRRIDPRALARALEAHEAFVRGEPGGVRAVLRDVDFAGFRLYGRDLSGADLRGSRFDRAWIGSVKFIDADLRGANLGDSPAGYEYAQFAGADLRGASYVDSPLSKDGGSQFWGAVRNDADAERLRIAREDRQREQERVDALPPAEREAALAERDRRAEAGVVAFASALGVAYGITPGDRPREEALAARPPRQLDASEIAMRRILGDIRDRAASRDEREM